MNYSGYNKKSQVSLVINQDIRNELGYVSYVMTGAQLTYSGWLAIRSLILIIVKTVSDETRCNKHHVCNWEIPSNLKYPIFVKRPCFHKYSTMGLLPDTTNCVLRMHRLCRKRFPRHQVQRKPLISYPGMHHGTCATHVPWCMSESLTRGGGKNVPGLPNACANRNFTYLARVPWSRPYDKQNPHTGRNQVIKVAT